MGKTPEERIRIQTIETTVDVATGEEVSLKKTEVFAVSKEPNFIKVYLDDILHLNGLSSGENSTLLALLRHMDYRNQIIINAALKRFIAKDIDRSINTINMAITQFVKSGILERIDVGMYRFNPFFFGKGNWTDIREIRMLTTYNPSVGRSVSISTKYSDEDSNVEGNDLHANSEKTPPL